jgi:L-ascorbate metabolism protein UlaG (beta-lactamase superfamily)
MKLTVSGHACVRIVDEAGTLVIDPGVFSPASALDDADAVLVTHTHFDHVDVPAVVAVLDARPAAAVWAPSTVADQLVEAGADAARVHVVAPGDALRVLDHDVDVIGGQHAVIHADVPVAQNVGFVVDGAVLHPGDSFVGLPDGADLDVLLTPISGPWLKTGEVVDFVRDIRPRRVVPIHDALLSELGRAGTLNQLGPDGLGKGHGYEVVDLADGTAIEVEARPEARAVFVGAELRREHPEFDDVPALEQDETVAPRPEEDVADAER